MDASKDLNEITSSVVTNPIHFHFSLLDFYFPGSSMRGRAWSIKHSDVLTTLLLTKSASLVFYEFY